MKDFRPHNILHDNIMSSKLSPSCVWNLLFTRSRVFDLINPQTETWTCLKRDISHQQWKPAPTLGSFHFSESFAQFLNTTSLVRITLTLWSFWSNSDIDNKAHFTFKEVNGWKMLRRLLQKVDWDFFFFHELDHLNFFFLFNWDFMAFCFVRHQKKPLLCYITVKRF